MFFKKIISKIQESRQTHIDKEFISILYKHIDSYFKVCEDGIRKLCVKNGLSERETKKVIGNNLSIIICYCSKVLLEIILDISKSKENISADALIEKVDPTLVDSKHGIYSYYDDRVIATFGHERDQMSQVVSTILKGIIIEVVDGFEIEKKYVSYNIVDKFSLVIFHLNDKLIKYWRERYQDEGAHMWR
jgi:hypothetical protein